MEYCTCAATLQQFNLFEWQDFKGQMFLLLALNLAFRPSSLSKPDVLLKNSIGTT